MTADTTEISYVEADKEMKARVAAEWGDLQARHMHGTDDGFSIVAMAAGRPVGLVSINWRQLPQPLAGAVEAFVDIIEVRDVFRRKGIASRMVGMAAYRARVHGACQLRAWSSEGRTEAIATWKALGFGLCPATVHPGGAEVRGYFATLPIRPA